MQVSEKEVIDIMGDVTLYQYRASELCCENNGQKIYGVAYIPETDKQVPLVIFAHGLGDTYSAGAAYAETLALSGIAVYTFDFRGGSAESQSEGKTTEMSIMTQASDLEAVLDAARMWDFVDSSRIVLIGEDHGGMAAAIMSLRRADDIGGLVLLYPALLVQDNLHNDFQSLDNFPEQFNISGLINVGKKYAVDAWDYDVFDEMIDYVKPVLILHGEYDSVVDMSYSEKAVRYYPDATLHIITKADHGFTGKNFDEAMEYIFEYLYNIRITEELIELGF